MDVLHRLLLLLRMEQLYKATDNGKRGFQAARRLAQALAVTPVIRVDTLSCTHSRVSYTTVCSPHILIKLAFAPRSRSTIHPPLPPTSLLLPALPTLLPCFSAESNQTTGWVAQQLAVDPSPRHPPLDRHIRFLLPRSLLSNPNETSPLVPLQTPSARSPSSSSPTGFDILPEPRSPKLRERSRGCGRWVVGVYGGG